MSASDILSGTSPIVKAFLAGSLSGTCSTILFQPLDVVKTRLQISSSATSRPTSSMTGELQLVVHTKGLSGLWLGLRASLYRTVPGVGLYFSSMHWMRNSLCEGKPSPLQSLMIGGTARTFAGAVMIPFTVVKTRMESGNFNYRSVTAALVDIIKTQGLKGLGRGLGPTLARDVPFSSLYLAFYDLLKSQTPGWLSSSSPESAHMLAGLGAGLLASIVTQPADVVKTRMQTGSMSSVISTVSSLYGEKGIHAFTAGLAPRMLRRSVMAAMAWTVYERINSTLSLK